jgi:hypothetical protein
MSFMLLGILNSQAAGGGDVSSFDLLSSTTLTSTPSSFTFSGLAAYAADYKHLQVRLVPKSNHSANTDGLQLRFNGSTSTYYARKLFTNHGGTIQSEDQTSSYMNFGSSIPGTVSSQNILGANIMDIYDFGNASKQTTVRHLNGFTTTAQGNVGISQGMTGFNAAITDISFKPWNGTAFEYGSRFTIYGVR